MDKLAFVNEWWFAYLVLPALIFVARIGDVSLDTMRVIYINRGRKVLAPLLGFFQVLIWLMAISQILRGDGLNLACVFGYAAGFAAGNYVGMIIEEKVAAGLLAIRVITQQDAAELVSALRGAGYGATTIPAQGAEGPVDVVFVVIRRKHLDMILDAIREFNPRAFYSIEEVRSASGGVYPRDAVVRGPLSVLRRLRDGGR